MGGVLLLLLDMGWKDWYLGKKRWKDSYRVDECTLGWRGYISTF